MPRKLKNLVGDQFGRLVVIEYAGKTSVGTKGQKASSWSCKCECGKEIVVLNNNLKRGNTQSCGCFHKKQAKESNLKDITGRRFGSLKAIRYVETRNKNAYWKCLCDCGKFSTTSACSLKNGKTQSCGCKQGNFVHGEWSKGIANYAKFRRQDPLVRLKHNVSSSIRSAIQSPKNNNKTFQYLPYTPKELKHHLENQFEDWMSWENYGGKSNDPKPTWWIYHIKPHSSFEYTDMKDTRFLECWDLSNLRPMEKKANIAKSNN